MASPAHHGLVKWYNLKRGYAFICDLKTGTDVFLHATGINRAFKEHPPREGEKVLLSIWEGVKGPVAKDVIPFSASSRHPVTNKRAAHTASTKLQEENDVQAKIFACVCTVKAIAGANHQHLRELIPLLLQHNGLPAVYVSYNAFAVRPHTKTRISCRTSPESEHCLRTPAKEEATNDGDNESEDEEEDDDEEGKDVDVLANTSEDNTATPVPTQPSEEDTPRTSVTPAAADKTPRPMKKPMPIVRQYNPETGKMVYPEWTEEDTEEEDSDDEENSRKEQGRSRTNETCNRGEPKKHTSSYPANCSTKGNRKGRGQAAAKSRCMEETTKAKIGHQVSLVPSRRPMVAPTAKDEANSPKHPLQGRARK
ncbi:Cold shock-like protein CspB [Portunus trituberculatus]|uniref:Cold shock-like protein CspB n=1 Tax=Portunus trituberculatus TaxID=210409 RepID=A0A5B7F2I3_PORTR|nr:Cold shock-like protein CspB [Portunus trituberculatus]